MKLKVLIVGAQGQDGTILRRYIHRNDNVLCLTSKSAFYGDGSKISNVGFSYDSLKATLDLVSQFAPDYVYYLAAAHGSEDSDRNNDEYLDSARMFIDCEGLLSLVRTLESLNKPIGFFYAASSKIFGCQNGRLNELSNFMPNCKYSLSKVSAIRYLESLTLTNLKIVIGILFHHHSRFRIGNYALNIIANQLAMRNHSTAKPRLRNFNASGDFSSAFEVCNAASQLLHYNCNGRYVIGSGVVRTLLQIYNDAELQVYGNNNGIIKPVSVESDCVLYADTGKINKLGIVVNDKIINVIKNQVVHLQRRVHVTQ